MKIHRNPVSWLLVVLAATLFATISFNRGFHQPPVTDVIPEVRGTTGPLAAHFVVKWEGRWWSSFMVEPFPMKIGWHFLSWSETCALEFDGLSSNFPFFHGGYESPSREAGGGSSLVKWKGHLVGIPHFHTHPYATWIPFMIVAMFPNHFIPFQLTLTLNSPKQTKHNKTIEPWGDLQDVLRCIPWLLDLLVGICWNASCHRDGSTRSWLLPSS